MAASIKTEWLPDYILYENSGSWEEYEKVLYDRFKSDFIDQAAYYVGANLSMKRHPTYKDKEATFWHMITEGPVEAERTPDFRRCERIGWARAVIDHHPCDEIKCWIETRKSERRVHLWLEDDDYIVVLAIRNGYYLLWTTFVIRYPHERAKFQRRYESGDQNC